MSRRQLPKVIMRVSDDDMSGAPVGLGAPDVQSVPPTETSPAHVIAAFGRDSDPVTSGAETAPETASASSTLPQAASMPDPATARRRARALRIVDRYVVYSAVGGIVPLPLVNVASITGLIVRMVKVLSDHYGVAFEKDRARAIVVGFVAGAMPSGLGSVASSTLTYLMPHSALAGLAVSSATAAACTRSIGRIFVEHFENGAALADLRVVDSVEKH
jgi:uncharacterized protein (DUF697 family)